MGVFTNGNNNLVGSSQQLPLNQWTHLATTLNGSTATIFINGNPVGSGTVLVPGNFVRTNNYFGRSLFGGDGYANAIFDDIRIWNVARTQTQIQQTMNWALTGAESGLIGYWRFDGGTGTASVDGTGNGNTATLVNNATWLLSRAPSGLLQVTTLPATAIASFSATLNGAHYLGLDKDIGSLEAGKLADVVVLDANPLDDIKNTTSIGLVVLNGRVYDSMTLDQIAPDPHKREPFFFQQKGGSGVGSRGAVSHVDD